MRLKRLIKLFNFPEQRRGLISLDADARLNPDTAMVQLKASGSGLYPTADDISFRTWEFKPTSVKQWLTIEEVVSHKQDDDGNTVTSTGYRVANGTDEYWWDGGAWVVNTTQWNTIAELAGNLSSFPLVGKTIQFVVNLKTTDASLTPEVEELKLLWASDIEFQEDLLYRTLIPSMREGIMPIGEYKIRLAADSSTIDLKNDYPLETPYTIADIDAVYDIDSDPEFLTDILDSYNPTTQVITLTGVVAADSVVRVRFIYSPLVSVTTSIDYDELAEIPYITLQDIDFVERMYGSIEDSVVNVADGTAVKVKRPMQGDLDILGTVVADKGLDLVRLAEQVQAYFETTPTLTSKGLDETYSLWLNEPYDARLGSDRKDLHEGQFRFRIKNVLFFLAGSEDKYAVQTFKLRGDMNTDIS